MQQGGSNHSFSGRFYVNMADVLSTLSSAADHPACGPGLLAISALWHPAWEQCLCRCKRLVKGVLFSICL